MTRRGVTAAMGVAIVALALVYGDDAIARVGGGQSFGSGSSGRDSSGGSGGGGSGGGGDGDALFMLLWLLINYPAIGIPLLIVVGVLYLATRTTRARDGIGVRAPPPQPRRADPLAVVTRADPAFSAPVFLDFFQLLHRRATEGAIRGVPHPFVSPEAQARLRALHPGITAVDQVVCARVEVLSARLRDGRVFIDVLVADSRLERTAEGERRVYVEESWTLARAADAVSPEPDRMRRLACPTCGSPAETDTAGACRSCGTRLDDGRVMWRAESVTFPVQRRALPTPEYAPAPGGAELGYTLPTVKDHDLPRKLRALTERHGGFAWPTFEEKVASTYLSLQGAWSNGDPDALRPFVTDNLYQTLRFWIERYAGAGLRNRLEDVQLVRTELTDITLDPWYSAVTVRIWGSMRDTVVTRAGEVVGGNPDSPRKFSEYWTLLRAAGGPATAHTDARCPSCAAPLDRVDPAGVCGYCETRITTGEHDWVLSRIEQAEARNG